MKRSSSLLLGALCAALLLNANPVFAQSNAKPPTQMTYQGFLTDGNGLPFGNTAPVNKTVIFRIYDSLSGGTLKWSSQQVVTVDKGYFSVLLGQGSAVGSEPFSADLTGVFTGAGASDRYLELNADGTTIAPRLRFLPAPSAMLAKSATELLDPVTGASALSVSGGAISGSGASLTSLNASQITSGTLANARTTATSANTANAIVTRDGSGNFSANIGTFGYANIGLVAQGFYVDSGNLALRAPSGGATFIQTSGGERTDMYIANSGNVGIGTTGPGSRLHVAGGDIQLSGGSFYLDNGKTYVAKNAAGAYETFIWPRWIDNITYLNYGSGGFNVRNNDSSSAMFLTSGGNVGVGTTSPSSKLQVAGQVAADSFKINNTPTYVLFNVSRFAFTTFNTTTAPMTGVSQTVGSGSVGRQGSPPSDWWKSTANWGLVFYSCTFTVPAGEMWEVDYTCNSYWATDDNGGIVWTLNDDLTDDSPSTTVGRSAGMTFFGQSFTLTGSGTYTVRVKGGFYGGSGSDGLYFPVGNPAHCVVKKYKSN